MFQEPAQLNFYIHQPASSTAWKPAIPPLLVFDRVRWLIEVESCSIYYLRSHFVSLNTVLKVHRCYGMWQYFIMSSAWMKFHYICATFCLFIILSLSIKVLSLDYCKGCNTLESVDSSWRCWFQFFSESSPM